MSKYLFPLFSWISLLTCLLLIECTPEVRPYHEIPKWEKLTLQFEGPEASENGEVNPFTAYELSVRFTHGDHSMTVPGYFAADGDAGNSGASSGNIWEVNFRPDKEGEWSYEATMLYNKEHADVSEPTGVIKVTAAKPGEKGRLIKKKDSPYLQYAETDQYFLKLGADSPENLLGYEDFDNTYYYPDHRVQKEGEDMQKLHRYEPHVKDWKTGDPTWQNGKGKGLIGGLNYLSSMGVNTSYFLTLNINGDGKDVWPYVDHESRDRFDCSKLDQWEMVFDHMDALGIMLHIVLQETENETMLDGGDMGPNRRIYLKELIARFAHHKGVTWNIGEENGPNTWSKDGAQTVQQVMDMSKYIAATDPYDNLIVVHTHPNVKEIKERMSSLLQDPNLTGLSLQLGKRQKTYEQTGYWVQESSTKGVHLWVVTVDEIGPHYQGLDPDDKPDNNQDSVRAEVLWANLMAYGGGIEYYFGYKNHNSDLQCEDWRSRDNAWKWSNSAIQFFHNHVNLKEMERFSSLVSDNQGYGIKAGDKKYVAYLFDGNNASLNLSNLTGKYSVSWYDPVNGGDLTKGSISIVQAGKSMAIGNPPSQHDATDWVVVLEGM